ncbi:hypothetical protein Tco_0103398 [Tanacetum coccineum]
MESNEQCIIERARHEQEIHNRLKRLNERKLQIQECMVQKVNASDARSRNECNDNNTSRDDSNIRPSYDTEPMVEVDSNVIPDLPDMCDNEIQTDQNAVECDDERVALANLIANLKLDVDGNKNIQKQLKKTNTSLAHELKECKSILAKTSRTLRESNNIRDTFVKKKHDELVKQILLTKSHYEGLVKGKTKVITDLKLKEEKDIDKMISMEKQLKFLNEIVYKRNQSIQTIHMLAPKGPTFNGRPTFANPIELVDQAWEKHSHDHFRAPTAYDMEILIKTCLKALAIKTQNDSFTFVHELKQEMHADLKYVESLEKEIDKLESDKVEFSNMYDILLQECVSNDVMCSYLHSYSNLDAHTELQCLYLHKVKECECLAQKLSKQTETVKQMKNDKVCKETTLNVFQKEREQYFEIQDLKAQLQDKNIAISELKKLIEKMKVVRQPTAYKSKRSQLPRHQFASQFGESHDLTKPVTPYSWPQVRKSSFAKPYNVNAPGPSRNSPKHVSFQSPRESVGLNDMVHNYYLEEAKKKAQLQKDKALNTKPSVKQYARLPNTANGNKPKPRNFN